MREREPVWGWFLIAATCLVFLLLALNPGKDGKFDWLDWAAIPGAVLIAIDIGRSIYRDRIK